MTAKEFYDEFKRALDAIGAGFHGMKNASAKIEGNRFIVSCNNTGNQYSFVINKEEKK